MISFPWIKGDTVNVIVNNKPMTGILERTTPFATYYPVSCEDGRRRLYTAEELIDFNEKIQETTDESQFKLTAMKILDKHKQAFEELAE